MSCFSSAVVAREYCRRPASLRRFLMTAGILDWRELPPENFVGSYFQLHRTTLPSLSFEDSHKSGWIETELLLSPSFHFMTHGDGTGRGGTSPSGPQ